MLDLKPISLDDKGWIDEILKQYDSKSCEYSFGNNYIWGKVYDLKIAKINEFYIAALEESNGISFQYPAGKGDVKPVIEELIEYCKQRSIQFMLHGITTDAKENLEKIFPNKFAYENDPGYADYIYNRDDLALLGGKKYHGKRNHIKRFKDNNWSFEKITTENIPDCLEMNRKWCVINDCSVDSEKRKEFCAIKRAFDKFFELEFFGGLLRVDGEVVAYSFGERLNSDTVVVHVEKAFGSLQGAYPTINQEFVLNLTQGYEYINREEDLGIEGLRKAKMSYYPAILLDKYSAVLR